MNNIIFITQNKHKAQTVKKTLSSFGIEVVVKNMKTPEIQSETCEEVAAFSAQWAANELKKPVIKTDAGLFIKVLNGFPGVYANQFYKKLGVEKLLKLLGDKNNRKAKIVCVLAYCEPNSKPTVFKHSIEGRISNKPKGKDGMLIDFIFIPKDSNKTLGELREIDPNLRMQYWAKAIQKFAKWFRSSS